MTTNEVYVTTNLDDGVLWKNEIRLGNIHWINEAPIEGLYQIRVRHRAPLISAMLVFDDSGVSLKPDDSQRAIAPGQSVVIYDGDVCLGGGVVI
jgi:tRNA-specific 2-thiouridylase